MPQKLEVTTKVPDAPDNSYAGRQKKQLTVVKGKVEDNSKSFFKGSVQQAGNSIMTDILIPAAKDTIYNMFSSFMSNILFGNSDIPQRGRFQNSGMRTMDGRQYNDYGAMTRNNGYSNRTTMQRSVYEYQNIEFETRADAELALGMLRDICDEQGFCTVLNLYEISGNQPNNTDNNWGWYSLPEGIVKVQKKFNGFYRLTLPPVTAIRY